MLEPTHTDATQTAPANRRLLIALWLAAAVVIGAGFGLVVSWIGQPAGLAAPSESAGVRETTSPSAEPSSAPSAAASATLAPSEAPSATPAAAPAAGDFADLRLELSDVEPTTTIGRVWDRDLAESVARQLGVDVGSLGVRSVATLTSDPLPPEWTAITVAYPGGTAVQAVGGYLAEQLRRPEERAGSGPIDDGERTFVIGEDWALGWSDGLLLLVGFDVEPYLEASRDERNAMPNPHLLITTVADRLLGEPTVGAASPSWRPFPSIGAEPTAPPDPTLEALLPTSILGHAQHHTSFAWLTAEQVSSIMGGLHPRLLTHFDRDPADASLALGSGTVSNFTMWAHRVRGLYGDELLGAVLGEQFAGLRSGERPAWEGREVEGRRYILNEWQGFYAADDVLYWILYFDFGDCFDECDHDTRPPFDEILREAIRAIPEP
jgi:hypothetical protein